jgi:hypothetical protein
MSEATVVCSGGMSLPDRENLPLPKPPLRSFRMAALRSKTKRCLFETRSTATEADSFPSIFCVNVFSVVCGTTGGDKEMPGPVLTPEVQKKLIDSVHAEVGSRTVAELEAERDEILLSLIELRTRRAQAVAPHEVAAE